MSKLAQGYAIEKSGLADFRGFADKARLD